MTLRTRAMLRLHSKRSEREAIRRSINVAISPVNLGRSAIEHGSQMTNLAHAAKAFEGVISTSRIALI